MFRNYSSGLLMATIVIACVSGAQPGNAQDKPVVKPGSMTHAIETLADNINSFCKSGIEPVGKLRVSPFSPPEIAKNPSAGKAAAKQLSDALAKRGLSMAQNDLDKATHSLNGEFTVNDTNSELVVQLIVSLKDSSGKEVNGFRAKVEAVEVSDREEITKTLGLTVDITPEKSKSVDNKPTEQILADRESKLAESAKTPTVAITNSQPSTPVNASAGGTTTTTASPDANGVKQTIIAPSLTSKFKIEVLVKNPLNEYVPTPASDVNGLAVVGLNEKDIYGVRIYNDFDFDVAVKLTLDGVNSLALSENPDFRRMGCWIIPKKDSGIVKGWHKNNNETQDFLVTSYPESVAKQLGGVAEGIGVIQAQFFPAWTGNDRPYVELAGIQKGDGAGGLGTGAGLKSNVKSESVTRFIGQSLLGAITVRYARPEVPKDLPTDAPPSK